MTSGSKRVVLSLGLVLLLLRSARADVPAEPAATPEESFASPTPAPPALTERRWYGWQIVLSDTAAAAAGVVAARTALAPLYALGALVYVGGGPALHAQHDHRDAFVPSLAARLVAPVVGVVGVIVVETSVCSSPPDGGYFYTSCQREGAIAAFVTPMILTSIIDIAASWTPARVVPSTGRSDFAWAPTLAPTRGAGATLGFVGRF